MIFNFSELWSSLDLRLPYLDLIMANAAASYIDDKNQGRSCTPVGGLERKPKFGMNKGIRIQAGHILWQGRYIDQNQFYKVSTVPKTKTK